MKIKKKIGPVAWPSDLVLSIARRRCVLFLGSGISCHAKNRKGLSPKGWRAFLESAMSSLNNKSLEEQIKTLLEKGDYLTACQVIKDKLPTDKFWDLVRDEYLHPEFKPTAIHKKIASLEANIIATPNFDKVYEHQAAGFIVKSYYDDGIAEAIRNPKGVILKIHGSVDSPERMIFSRAEYARARNKYRDFYAVLDALALTHTLLFLGCGLDDPDIRLVLEDYAFTHHYGKPHYYVLPNGHVHRHVHPTIERSLNIKLLTYDKRDDHRLLIDALDELSFQVSLQRRELAKTLHW